MNFAGRLTEVVVPSTLLGEAIRCSLYEPPGLPEANRSLLVLLHGRGGSHKDWHPVLDVIDTENRQHPPLVLLPDAPWLRRSSYWVDSSYTGPGEAGRPVASAVAELIASPPAQFRVSPERSRRTLGGVSMGGAGALNLALTRPKLAATTILLSPAVYVPQPPMDSSTRAAGAYGRGAALFDEDHHAALSYPAALAAYPGAPLRMFIAVGTDERAGDDPNGIPIDPREQAYSLARASTATPGIDVRFRLLSGGHTWPFWRRALAEGLRWASRAEQSRPR